MPTCTSMNLSLLAREFFQSMLEVVLVGPESTEIQYRMPAMRPGDVVPCSIRDLE